MTRVVAKRPPVGADIKAARKLMDELVQARQEIRDQRRDIDMLNRRAAKAEREVRELKARKVKAPAKLKGPR